MNVPYANGKITSKTPITKSQYKSVAQPQILGGGEGKHPLEFIGDAPFKWSFFSLYAMVRKNCGGEGCTGTVHHSLATPLIQMLHLWAEIT